MTIVKKNGWCGDMIGSQSTNQSSLQVGELLNMCMHVANN